MAEALTFVITAACIVISERLLNKYDRRQHKSLGGQNVLVWLPSQLSFLGYLLTFQHKNIWQALGWKKIFIISASIGQWLCIGIVFNGLFSLL